MPEAEQRWAQTQTIELIDNGRVLGFLAVRQGKRAPAVRLHSKMPRLDFYCGVLQGVIRSG
jgi:hypothetical protein